MRLRPRPRPGVEAVGVRLRRHLLEEGVRGRAKASIRREGDGLELDVEVLVVDDLVGGLVLGVGVDVGGGTTSKMNRGGIFPMMMAIPNTTISMT